MKKLKNRMSYIDGPLLDTVTIMPSESVDTKQYPFSLPLYPTHQESKLFP